MKQTTLLLFLFTFYFAAAQKQKQMVMYGTAIHFSPLALIQVDYTVLVGGEYRLKPNLGLVADIGYIFGSAYLDPEDNQASGFVFRPSIRFYSGRRNNFYVQPQIFYKLVTHKVQDWLGMDCDNGVAAFQQLKEFKYRRNIYGLNATIGRVFPLDTKNRAFVDLFIGLGLRYKKSSVVGNDCSCYQPTSILFTEEDPDNGFFPSLPGGVKLVFALW
ncbi:MAG: hypothetical protein ACJ749_17905 [Flavisolibacter sp.]